MASQYLIINILSAVLVLACIYELIEFVYRQSSKYKSTLGGCQFFHSVPDGLDIVNIGSGPGRYAISYDHCTSRGFNFATAPQNYKYGFRLLKRFKDNINRGAIVIIIIMSPLSFGKNNDYDRTDYSDRFYGILPKEDIDNYSLRRYWISRHPLTCKIARKICSRLSSKHNENITSNASEPGIIRVWKKEFGLKNLTDADQSIKHLEAFKEKTDILKDGLDFCLENGWRPVLVIPPVPSNTRKYIGKDFLQKFVYDNLKVLQNEFKDIRLLDYYSDERITDDCFRSDIFVNERGKETFSKILFNDIDIMMGKKENG